MTALGEGAGDERASAFARARALLDLGRPAEAASLLSALLAARPDDADAFVLLSEAHLDRDDAGETLRAAERAVALDPENDRAHYFRGLGLWNARVRGRRLGWGGAGANRAAREATAAVEEAARLGPFQPGYPVTLGRMRLDLRDVDGAERHFRRALELHPHSEDAFVGLALAALRRKDAVLAEASARKALALNPTSTDALGALAWARLRLGDPHAALAGARDAARLAPGDPEARAHLVALVNAYLPRPLGRGSPVWRALIVPQAAVFVVPLFALALGARNLARWSRLPPELREAVRAVRASEGAGFDVGLALVALFGVFVLLALVAPKDGPIATLIGLGLMLTVLGLVGWLLFRAGRALVRWARRR